MFKPVVNAANPHSTVLGGTATVFIERSIYNHKLISNSFDVRNMMFDKIVFPTKKNMTEDFSPKALVIVERLLELLG